MTARVLVHLWEPRVEVDERGHVRAPCGAMTGELRDPNGYPVKVAERSTKPERITCEGCRRARGIGPVPPVTR